MKSNFKARMEQLRLSRLEQTRLERTLTWISVEDRLPQEGKSVLLFDRDNGVLQGHSSFNQVTHWMEFPDKPGDK